MRACIATSQGSSNGRLVSARNERKRHHQRMRGDLSLRRNGVRRDQALGWTPMVASTLRNDSEFNPVSRSAGEAKRLSQRVSYVACRAIDSRRHRASAQ